MSRDLADLTPTMQEKAREVIDIFDNNSRNKQRGVTLLIYCTYRTFEEQAKLFRQGRSFYMIQQMAIELWKKYGRADLYDILLGVGPQYGKKVTYAAPGQSMHNYRMAFDAVALDNGKLLWDRKEPAWQRYGKAVREAGLEWAGDWKRFKEFPHAQYPGVDWKQMI